MTPEKSAAPTSSPGGRPPSGLNCGLSVVFVLVGAGFLFGAAVVDPASLTDDGYSLQWFFAGMGGFFCAMPVVLGLLAAISARRAAYMNARGLDGTAVIVAVEETGVMVNDQPRLRLQLEVCVLGRPPYALTHVQIAALTELARLRPGSTVQVKVDPDDLQQIRLV
jgi:hypothetical protein